MIFCYGYPFFWCREGDLFLTLRRCIPPPPPLALCAPGEWNAILQVCYGKLLDHFSNSQTKKKINEDLHTVTLAATKECTSHCRLNGHVLEELSDRKASIIGRFLMGIIRGGGEKSTHFNYPENAKEKVSWRGQRGGRRQRNARVFCARKKMCVGE